MAQAVVYKVHADHPERHKIAKVVEALAGGALLLFPTDSVFAVGCDPRDHRALERLRALKPVDERRPLTILCPSIASVSTYAHVDDASFKLMRSLTPGPVTFILKATKEVPRLVLNPKRRTAGVRVPDSPICQALLESLGGVIVSSSARLPDDGALPRSKEELFAALAPRVDIIVDDGTFARDFSTVLDMTGDEIEIVREGLAIDQVMNHVR